MRIDRYAYASRLRDFYPNARIAAGLLPLLCCISLNAYSAALLVIFVLGLASIVCCGISVQQYLKLLTIPTAFLLIGTITVMIVPTSGASYGITKTSFNTGVLLIVKSLGAVSCMYFISLNTTMTDMAHGLKSMRTPPLLISLITLVYRYIFIVLEEASRMQIAQSSRLGDACFYSKLRAAGQLFGALFVRCMQKGDAMYNALASRGYENNIPILTRPYLPSAKLWMSSAAFSCALIFLSLWEKRLI